MKTMKEQLKQWVKVNPMPAEPKSKQKSKKEQPAKRQERLTERDLRDLMGTGMQRLKRGQGGALRR